MVDILSHETSSQNEFENEQVPKLNLSVEPAVILELRLTTEFPQETPFIKKIAAYNHRIHRLEEEFDIAQSQAANSKNPEALNDSQVYRIEILAARAMRDEIIQEQKDTESDENRKSLLSAAGRKGAYTRQLRSIQAKLAEFDSAEDTKTPEYQSILDRLKVLQENFNFSLDQFNQAKTSFNKAKAISEEELLVKHTLAEMFKSETIQNLEKIAQTQADAPEKQAQLSAITREHEVAKAYQSQIHFGLRRNYLREFGNRILRKVGNSPKLQTALKVIQSTAIAAPIVASAGMFFADFLSRDISGSSGQSSLSTMTILNQAENDPQYTIADKPFIKNPPVEPETTQANISDDDVEIPPYPVELPPNPQVNENTNEQIEPTITESADIVLAASQVESTSVVESSQTNDQNIIEQITQNAQKLNLPPEIITQLTTTDLPQITNALEREKLIAFPGTDPITQVIVDYLLRSNYERS